MGGSLAAAIRKKFPKAHIVGVARRRTTLDFARRKKWIHEGFLDLRPAVQDADLVVICTPIDLTQNILKQIDQYASRKVLVTDVGSVKTPICKFAEKRKWKHVRFVGAHPMVGSHEQGIEAARSDLYDLGLTIITAAQNQNGFTEVKKFWSKIGKKTLVIDSVKHDLWVAEISHLPHLLATCLMLTASRTSLQIASSGFRDMTRLAEGPSSVWQPILSENKKAALRALQSFKSNLKQLEASLKSSKPQKIASFLSQAARQRQALFPSKKS